MIQGKRTLDLVLVLIEVSIFVLVALSLLYALQEKPSEFYRQTLVRWIFLPSIYIFVYVVVYFRKINNVLLNHLLITNLFCIGAYLFILSKVIFLDSINFSPLFNLVFFYFISLFGIVTFVIFPYSLLLLSLFLGKNNLISN